MNSPKAANQRGGAPEHSACQNPDQAVDVHYHLFASWRLTPGSGVPIPRRADTPLPVDGPQLPTASVDNSGSCLGALCREVPEAPGSSGAGKIGQKTASRAGVLSARAVWGQRAVKKGMIAAGRAVVYVVLFKCRQAGTGKQGRRSVFPQYLWIILVERW
jgi:hypothetical protein